MNEILQAAEAAVRRIVTEELNKVLTGEVVAKILTDSLNEKIEEVVREKFDEYEFNDNRKFKRMLENTVDTQVDEKIAALNFEVRVS